MAYPVKAVANAFLDFAKAHGAPLTPLKLQKLVYIAHGWHLGLFEDPLVSDELPEAWQYGPVFPSLYRQFRTFGADPISRHATELTHTRGFDFEESEPSVPVSDVRVMALLKKVWDQYGKYGGIGLSELTHQAGTPWDETRKESGGVQNADITNDMVRRHYKELIEKRRKSVAVTAG